MVKMRDAQKALTMYILNIDILYLFSVNTLHYL